MPMLTWPMLTWMIHHLEISITWRYPSLGDPSLGDMESRNAQDSFRRSDRKRLDHLKRDCSAADIARTSGSGNEFARHTGTSGSGTGNKASRQCQVHSCATGGPVGIY